MSLSRFPSLALTIVVLICIAMLASPTIAFGSSGSSWAIGVVVPEGSTLSNETKVNWNEIRNVTAIFNIPDISSTDGTIYAIMSLMTENGSIIQVAAGLYPNSSCWLPYATYISNPNSYPQSYCQIQIPNQRKMFPGDLISISIYLLNAQWWFRINDITRNYSMISYFNYNISDTLKNGGQYVFALESYTSNSSVFESMSNMTLEGLFLNGAKVTGGWYLYTTWNNENFPLFIVGGATPPQFIEASFTGNGSIAWSYDSEWSAEAPSAVPFYFIYAVFGSAAVANVIVLALLMLKKRSDFKHAKKSY